jgi:hypothetical protein
MSCDVPWSIRKVEPQIDSEGHVRCLRSGSRRHSDVAIQKKSTLSCFCARLRIPQRTIAIWETGEVANSQVATFHRSAFFRVACSHFPTWKDNAHCNASLRVATPRHSSGNAARQFISKFRVDRSERNLRVPIVAYIGKALPTGGAMSCSRTYRGAAETLPEQCSGKYTTGYRVHTQTTKLYLRRKSWKSCRYSMVN